MLTIWIVDDVFDDLKKAQDVVSQITDRFPLDISIKSSRRFTWPSSGQNQDLGGPLPDILVLDLVEKDVARGDMFRGREFYENLRKHEEKENRLPAFVIIWSGRWDNADAVKFVNDVIETDDFIHDLRVKDKHALKKAVEGFIKRIQEER